MKDSFLRPRIGRRNGRVAMATIAGGVVCFAAATAAHADINLHLRSTVLTVDVGETFDVFIVAVSDSDVPQSLSAVDTIIGWDPTWLELVSADAASAGDAIFADDPFGINEASPPADGDALLTYLAPFGSPIDAMPAGTAIARITFRGVATTELTPLDILDTAGDPPGSTRVFDGTVPGLDVLGIVKGTAVTVIDCVADLTDDGIVGFQDLLVVLGLWGDCPASEECFADLNDDGNVGQIELLTVLAAWGTCPTD
ncbi:MAG: hypothetical protein HKO59_13465 [Phycisphaerales bacterium]|nr:hypothetical protein [Phycisphaerae bacterium]NNF43965.1 hypothetical protein [Phycisphaerales bacterium]NNM26971.1 hypothetical protein [Phycisphaerales bacterium]